ncbi:putative CtpA-like serine protease [compost metagenome]
MIQGGITQPFPIHILLNEYSASASEVLSGALRDYDVAQVIGMNSYGKGSVQQLLQLESGGALKVTIQEYLTPKLHKVNKVGIKPDLEVDGSAAQMITALHQAGLQEVTIELSKHKLTMNGVEVKDAFAIIRENGHLYAPTRALAALIDAKISWDDVRRSVQITSGQSTTGFAADTEDLLIYNGTSYVNIDAFESSFPQLQVKDDGEKITIQAGKGN